jgi:PAS domain S-box-containing protein
MPNKKATGKAFTETTFRLLTQHANEGIAIYDSQGVVKYVNESICRLSGYKEREVLGKPSESFVHPDDRERRRRLFSNLQPGQSATVIQRLRHKKGHYLLYRVTLTNFLQEPSVRGIVANMQDVSDKQQAKDQADDYQVLLETITENVQDGIFLGMFGEKFLYANSAFLKMAGYKSFQELEKIRPRDLYVDDNRRLEILKTLAATRVVRNIEVEFYRKNKSKIWVRMTISLLNGVGRENQYIGTVQDVTEQKQAEEKLKKSQGLLLSISNNVEDAFFRSSPAKGLLYVNQSYLKMFGYQSLAEIQKMKPTGFYAISTARKKLIAKQRAGERISNVDVLYKRKDGSTFWGSLSSTPHIDERGNFLMDGVIRDITDIKKNEEKIQQLNANLQAIMESTQESIYALDTDLRYLAYNQNHKRIMKLLYGVEIEVGGDYKSYLKGSADEKWFLKEVKHALQGKHFEKEYHVNYKRYQNRDISVTFNPIIGKKQELKGVAIFVVDITHQKRAEERANRFLANLTAVLESTKDRIFAVDKEFKYIIFNKAHSVSAQKISGKQIQVGDAILKIFTKREYPGLETNINRAFKGEHFMTETVLPDKSIVEVSYSPIKDTTGRVTGAAAFLRDVSLRKKNEQKIKLLNEELITQNWKLEAREEELKITLEELSERNFELDQFMYKTSHDLRAPLSSVLGLINLAKLDSERDRIDDYFEKIEGRVRKLDEFVRSMLSYAKVSRAEVVTTEVNLEEMANSCIRELEYLDNFTKMQVTIMSKIKAPFKTDTMTLRLVFANIISNAYKYYNPAVRSQLKINMEVTALRATIGFTDNGIGIHKEHLNRIFEMFFRATERSEGSGLGMYIVKQAVDKLGGKINIDSEYGTGTTIRLVIPNL